MMGDAASAWHTFENFLADHGVSGVSTMLSQRPQGGRLFDILREGVTPNENFSYGNARDKERGEGRRLPPWKQQLCVSMRHLIPQLLYLVSCPPAKGNRHNKDSEQKHQNHNHLQPPFGLCETTVACVSVSLISGLPSTVRPAPRCEQRQ
jgi:hypothetical protein